MLDKYKEESQKISVPARLKAETLIKMEEAKRKKQLYLGFKVAFATLSILVVAVVSFQWMQPSYIKTKLADNKVVDEVELEDGTLTYEEIDSLKVFGGGITTKREISEEMATAYIDLQSFSFTDYTLAETKFYGNYKGLDLSFVEVQQMFKNKNKRIEIRCQYGNRNITTNSKIGKHNIFVSYNQNKGKIEYNVYFKEGDLIYALTMNELTQKESIDIITQFLKKFS